MQSNKGGSNNGPMSMNTGGGPGNVSRNTSVISSKAAKISATGEMTNSDICYPLNGSSSADNSITTLSNNGKIMDSRSYAYNGSKSLSSRPSNNPSSNQLGTPNQNSLAGTNIVGSCIAPYLNSRSVLQQWPIDDACSSVL